MYVKPLTVLPVKLNRGLVPDELAACVTARLFPPDVNPVPFVILVPLK